MKLTKQQNAVLNRASQEPIIALKNHTYSWTDGRNVNARVVHKLISNGHLVANNDCLLPGFSQTYSEVKNA